MHRLTVCRHDVVRSREGCDQHQERRLREMEVRDDDIDGKERVAGKDLQTGATRVGANLAALTGGTRLKILPGDPFLATDVIITNFHLPQSTLLMLISAFAGTEFVMGAYRDAVRESYRFYSFGDAMLILP